jgi:hypothetical protein
MACRCQQHLCSCRKCPECHQKNCRCCCADTASALSGLSALSALSVMPQEDLVKAHDAHVAALAHLELALAALDGLPTGVTWSDWSKKKLKDAYNTVKDSAVKLKKATYDDNKDAVRATVYKVVDPIARTSVGKAVIKGGKAVGKAIANSKVGQGVAAARIAGSKERKTATAEHEAHDKEFERRRKEDEAAAAALAAKQAKQNKDNAGNTDNPDNADNAELKFKSKGKNIYMSGEI